MIFCSAAFLSATAALAANDPVPQFNIQHSCRIAGTSEVGHGRTIQACANDEERARTELEKQWSSLAPGDRSKCTKLTTMAGAPSYVELLTCLELMREANKHPQDRDATSTTGQGR